MISIEYECVEGEGITNTSRGVRRYSLPRHSILGDSQNLQNLKTQKTCKKTKKTQKTQKTRFSRLKTLPFVELKVPFLLSVYISSPEISLVDLLAGPENIAMHITKVFKDGCGTLLFIKQKYSTNNTQLVSVNP